MSLRTMFLAVLLLGLLQTASLRADIYDHRFDFVIPGTEGITPGPGVQLDHLDLTRAFLQDYDMMGANFAFSDLTDASLSESTLTSANFTGAVVKDASLSDTTSRGFTKEQLYSTASYQAKQLQGIGLGSNDLTGWDFTNQDLTGAVLRASTLTDANFMGAVVKEIRFDDTTSRGFTKEQLYSTASYQAKSLQGIRFRSDDLTAWDFSGQNLTGAWLSNSTLTSANFAFSDLTGAWLWESTLTSANFAGALVRETRFEHTTSRGFTKEQLYSTASYQAKQLQGIGLGSNDLTGWDFSDQDLTGASLYESTLTDVNFAGAVVKGAGLSGTTSRGFTKEQLYSTASYQAKQLQGIGLGSNDLTGWDFSDQDLTGASLYESTLTDVNFAGAVVKGAGLSGTTSRGFTKEQLYSTASYQEKNLQGISLASINRGGGDIEETDLSGWDFTGQILTDASFWLATLTNASFREADLTNGYLVGSDLTNADLSGANLTDANLNATKLADANLTGAVINGVHFRYTTSEGFTREQFYSTASYQEKNLQRVALWHNDLTGWDFSGQDLTDAILNASTLTDADFTGAVVTGAAFGRGRGSSLTKEQLYSTASYQDKNLREIKLTLNTDLTDFDFSGQDLANARVDTNKLAGASFAGANLSNVQFNWNTDLSPAAFDSTTIYNQWTVFPDRFDPDSRGLTLKRSPPGDFDADDVLNATDVNLLGARLRRWYMDIDWREAMLDVNGDASVDHEDLRVWVKDLKQTWFGDANLDLEFNSSDMVQVFAAGKYETGEDAGWAEGDWDGSGVFDSSDMVAAFADGGYEKGPRPGAVAVPEPGGWLLLILATTFPLISRRSMRSESVPQEQRWLISKSDQ